ncbi:MAG: ABC transporter permease [bacterium]|nr:ABC transporter permease [bacterium]
MLSFFALFMKELCLLFRDKFGLIVLFIMPAVLVVVVTSVQNVNFENSKIMPVKILFINNDAGQIGSNITSKLEESNDLRLIRKINKKNISIKQAQELLSAGKYHALLIIPQNTSKIIGNYIESNLRGEKISKPHLKISIVFDPAINPALAETLQNGLKLFISQVEIHMMEKSVQKALGNSTANSDFKTPSWVSKSYVRSQQNLQRPNPVQQNVPAWTLFGMFFIVVPLSGTLIKERHSSVMVRLLSTPMSPVAFLSSKIFAYVIINMIQLIVMLSMGLTVLPWLGTPLLVLSGHYGAIFVIGIMASLAATGFGLLVGAIAKSFHQASMLGPVLIVIAAAIGGIMVPAYLMPPAMQKMIYLSPLSWGHEAFVNVLVRNYGITQIYPQLFKLLLFFCVTFIISIVCFKRELTRQR